MGTQISCFKLRLKLLLHSDGSRRLSSNEIQAVAYRHTVYKVCMVRRVFPVRKIHNFFVPDF